jgi:long-subunit acyl-CoA synthetase (AMP-forming)
MFVSRFSFCLSCTFAVEPGKIYGMSESTGPCTFGLPSQYKYGSAGKVLEGLELKLDSQDEHGEGELCFRGRSMFLGYLDDPEASAKVFDPEGFFRTGDLGILDEDGFVFITGRAKELLKTSGGENVAPLLVEEALMEAMPAISRAVAIGDNRKFLSCLLLPHMNDAGELVGPATEVCSTVRTGAEAAADPRWHAYAKHGIERANEKAVSAVAKVKRFSMLTHNFTVDPPGGGEKGELTPTYKLRRKVVEQMYSEQIDAMYR